LDECAVLVRASPTLTWTEAVDATSAFELQGGLTLGGLLLAAGSAGALAAGSLFFHVQPPMGLAARAGDGALTRADLAEALQNLSLGQPAKSYQMSSVSRKHTQRVVSVCALGVGGRLQLPDLGAFMPSAASLQAFKWGVVGEEAASSDLRALLEGWVKSGAQPPIANLFYDARSHKRHEPIEFDVEGVGTFKGVPDLVIAHRGIGLPEAMLPLVASAAVSVDWETPQAMDKRASIAAIGEIHALAMAHAHDFVRGVPVFVTDLATGFRCWLVAAQSIWYLHPDRDLTLAEGVALVRCFLSMDAAHLVPLVRDGSLVFVPATGASAAAAPPSAGVPPPEVTAPSAATALPSVSGAPSWGKGSTRRAACVPPAGLASGHVSPDRFDDDLGAVAAQIALELARGGGFPRVLISSGDC